MLFHNGKRWNQLPSNQTCDPDFLTGEYHSGFYPDEFEFEGFFYSGLDD